MMPRPPARRPPLWFELALVVSVGLAARLLALDAAAPAPVSLAFFGWLIAIGQAVWTAIQAIGQAALVVLQWAVTALTIVVTKIGEGLKEFGGLFLRAGKHIWEFFRATYVHVLRPMWDRIWRFVDWARRALDDVFRPVFKFLRAIQHHILKFYNRFIRPVLDTIGLLRKMLRIADRLGLEWAKKLDEKLAGIEEWIDARVRDVLGKVNEAINLIDRIVTADGLFQRLALVRSIERDILGVRNALANAFSRPLTDAQRTAALARDDYKSGAAIIRDSRVYLETGDGPHAASIREFSADLWLRLSRG